MTHPLIIAVDGPAASGKGTIAARLAQTYGLPHLDTGLLYRAVGMGLLDRGGALEDATLAGMVAGGLDVRDLRDSERLTSRGAGEAASRVAGYPGVRAALLDFQRSFAVHPPEGAKGAVLDGRDIGTVVCPDADVKLFVTASDEVRAQRRFKELQENDPDVIYARVLEEMRERDARDRSRAVAPLEPAEDAILLDTSDLNADEVFVKALDIIQK